MRHYIKIVAVLGTLVIALMACSDNNEEPESNNENNDRNKNIVEDDDRDVQDMVDHMEAELKDQNIEIDNAEERVYQGDAYESMQLFIENNEVSISKYDPDSDELLEARENGYFDNGKGFPDDNAKVNGVFSMIGYDKADGPVDEEFSEETEKAVVEAFESF